MYNTQYRGRRTNTVPNGWLLIHEWEYRINRLSLFPIRVVLMCITKLSLISERISAFTPNENITQEVVEKEYEEFELTESITDLDPRGDRPALSVMEGDWEQIVSMECTYNRLYIICLSDDIWFVLTLSQSE
jgi:hypothetical protein